MWSILAEDGLFALMKSAYRYGKWKRLYREYFIIAIIYFLLRGRILTRSNDFYYLKNFKNGNSWLLPGLRATYHTLNSYQNRITKQFFDNKYIGISQEDVVFEVGAYIGGSTLGIAEKAAHVYAIEASPRNVECLRHNMRDLANVTVIHKAAWQKPDTLEMQYGIAADDDSLLTPDKGSLGKTTEVQADTVANIADEVNVDHIDFLKVEAEGVEPEVVEGVLGISVDKITVDCGPERDGEHVTEEVSNRLDEMGYNVVNDGKMVYAQIDRQ
jgi:FkbM family methyltransferase